MADGTIVKTIAEISGLKKKYIIAAFTQTDTIENIEVTFINFNIRTLEQWRAGGEA